jgi:hypothetical protein
LSILWDVFNARRSVATKAVAQAKGLDLVFVPAGETAHWPPLDRRIFGNLQAAATTRFIAVNSLPGPSELDLNWVIRYSIPLINHSDWD